MPHALQTKQPADLALALDIEQFVFLKISVLLSSGCPHPHRPSDEVWVVLSGLSPQFATINQSHNKLGRDARQCIEVREIKPSQKFLPEAEAGRDVAPSGCCRHVQSVLALRDGDPAAAAGRLAHPDVAHRHHALLHGQDETEPARRRESRSSPRGCFLLLSPESTVIAECIDKELWTLFPPEPMNLAFFLTASGPPRMLLKKV